MCWNHSLGISGISAPFHCQQTKATEVTPPTVNAEMTWLEPHGYWPPAQIRPNCTEVSSGEVSEHSYTVSELSPQGQLTR